MPYLYTDSDHMWRVLDGEIGDAFLESVSADDVIGLSWYDAGARNFYNSVKPVTCLEDLKGMRIRVQESDLAVDMVEALGATAIPIAYGDVYASLERQVVDGAENNWPSYEAMRHYEVAKYGGRAQQSAGNADLLGVYLAETVAGRPGDYPGMCQRIGDLRA